MAEVSIERKILKVPTIDDPERKVYQVQYSEGALPPRFLYIPVAEWSKEEEVKRIKADIESRKQVKKEIVEL